MWQRFTYKCNKPIPTSTSLLTYALNTTINLCSSDGSTDNVVANEALLKLANFTRDAARLARGPLRRPNGISRRIQLRRKYCHPRVRYKKFGVNSVRRWSYRSHHLIIFIRVRGGAYAAISTNYFYMEKRKNKNHLSPYEVEHTRLVKTLQRGNVSSVSDANAPLRAKLNRYKSRLNHRQFVGYCKAIGSM